MQQPRQLVDRVCGSQHTNRQRRIHGVYRMKLTGAEQAASLAVTDSKNVAVTNASSVRIGCFTLGVVSKLSICLRCKPVRTGRDRGRAFRNCMSMCLDPSPGRCAAT